MTRARELAVAYPSLSADAPAADVARVLAGYLLEDQALAQVLEEGAAELLWQRLEGHTAAELLPTTSQLITRLLGAP